MGLIRRARWRFTLSLAVFVQLTNDLDHAAKKQVFDTTQYVFGNFTLALAAPGGKNEKNGDGLFIVFIEALPQNLWVK